jgi:hypothetical protein
MLKKLLIIACASLVLAAPSFAAGWRTGLVASNEDRSDFTFIYDFNQTTLAKVQALRVRMASTMTVKVTAEVECERGESKASRKLTFSQTAGTRLRPLPVPVRGGVCTIELDVSASDAGRYDLLLQYQ